MTICANLKSGNMRHGLEAGALKPKRKPAAAMVNLVDGRRKYPVPSVSILRKQLAYDPATGILMRKQANSMRVTGWKNSLGYVGIQLNGVRMRAHRVIMAMMTGRWNSKEVDHINGNKADNRWCNLRQATFHENRWNENRRRTNTSGIKGVCRATNGRWQAQIDVYGQRYWIGKFKTKREAARRVKAARIRLHGQFANHG